MNEFLLMIFRAAITVTLFALFVALIFWAWSPKRRKQFDEAANLVFDDTDPVSIKRAPVKQETR
jgi:cytochrome c oxidase cbb3-type subunit IV